MLLGVMHITLPVDMILPKSVGHMKAYAFAAAMGASTGAHVKEGSAFCPQWTLLMSACRPYGLLPFLLQQHHLSIPGQGCIRAATTCTTMSMDI